MKPSPEDREGETNCARAAEVKLVEPEVIVEERLPILDRLAIFDPLFKDASMPASAAARAFWFSSSSLVS